MKRKTRTLGIPAFLLLTGVFIGGLVLILLGIAVRKLDRPSGRQESVGFKKNTAAADGESTANSQVLHSAFVQQFVLKLQGDLTLDGHGNIRTETLRAFPEEEYWKIIASLP